MVVEYNAVLMVCMALGCHSMVVFCSLQRPLTTASKCVSVVFFELGNGMLLMALRQTSLSVACGLPALQYFMHYAAQTKQFIYLLSL